MTRKSVGPIFGGKSRPIFSPIFTKDYYQACLIKSVGPNDFCMSNHYFNVILPWDSDFLHYIYGISNYKCIETDSKL